ncbi:hypothetical protein LARV_00450 [Longilinea arvoryzae]|uniref:Uncharacterized protein n=1 Tax=Longilinea arvoryzae TaxID=360412 RepID=A0A0S7BGX6_9CHLR|nr:DUF2208 domain-containing protein [Longilinea arvoryzae]GAP12714.1 hypothetical protein LARV_00450 [Longilinea arvoryzae]
MSSVMLPLLFFAAGMVFGGRSTYRKIKMSRRTGQITGVLHEWTEAPLPAWEYERISTTAILIHVLAVFVLSAAALPAFSNPGILNEYPESADRVTLLMVWFAQYFGAGLIGFLSGSVLISFPLIIYRHDPVAYAITEKGIVHDRTLLPWESFSRFSLERDRRMVSLYSTFAPDLPALILRPPAVISLTEVATAIHGFLPDHAPEGERAWYRTRFCLIPAMILACAPFVLLGWLVARLPREAALFGIALLTMSVVSLGGQILNLFAFGTRSPGVRSRTQNPTA